MRRFALLSTVLLALFAACGSEAEPTQVAETPASSTSTTEATTPSTVAVASNPDAAVEVTGKASAMVQEPYQEAYGPKLWGSQDAQGAVNLGQTYTGTLETSDERLNGETEVVISCGIYAPSQSDQVYVGQCWGTQKLVTEEGVWEGFTFGTSTWSKSEPAHVHDLTVVLYGTGEYEGLVLVGKLTGENPPWDLTGTIEPVESQ
jgi:hypothetical protein